MDDVYFLYNKRMYNYGIILMPIAIIPMVIILYCCNKMAKRRNFKRIEHILHQMRRSDVNKELLEKLLEEAV
uniref:Uncharacterized protein n=1 Tax=Acrobeloides nanus TaxID=290746 RepID=A0A914EEL3_9BILA